MTVDVNRLATFADQRRDILETIQMVKRGEMTSNVGMTVASLHKVLNENMQVEINVVKLQNTMGKEGAKFVEIVGMGKMLIGNT